MLKGSWVAGGCFHLTKSNDPELCHSLDALSLARLALSVSLFISLFGLPLTCYRRTGFCPPPEDNGCAECLLISRFRSGSLSPAVPYMPIANTRLYAFSHVWPISHTHTHSQIAVCVCLYAQWRDSGARSTATRTFSSI